MPKKITNPLRAGLPSKIYFLAYNGPISGYRMAQKIYGERYPPTSKIYEWTKKLEKQKIVAKTERGFVSSVDPLVSEIEKTLENYHSLVLTEFEKYVVRKILDSPEFRSYVEDANCNIPLDQDFDSAQVITGALGMTASNILVSFRIHKVPMQKAGSEKEFDELWDSLKIRSKESKLVERRIKMMLEKEEKVLEKFKDLMPIEAKSLQQRMEGFRQNPTKLAPFLAIPEGLLKKLSKLSPLGELFPSLIFNMHIWMTKLMEDYPDTEKKLDEVEK